MLWNSVQGNMYRSGQERVGLLKAATELLLLVLGKKDETRNRFCADRLGLPNRAHIHSQASFV